MITVFLGTPAASIPSLLALSSHTELRLVVTRPDQPRGRSGRPRPSPVKETAVDLGVPVAQPSSPEELEGVLREATPFDVGVVVAFGMILRAAALSIPKRGFVNVHFSLLPRWRGAAPVERAILAGDGTTGVTLMGIDEGLDTGPVIAAQRTPVAPDESAGELTARLADLGADLLMANLAQYVEGRSVPRPQSSDGACYANRISTDEAVIEASWPSVEVLRAVRAFSPRPGARFAKGKLKIWKAAPTELQRIETGRLEFDGSRLYLGTSDHPIELVEVQAPGGKPMSGAAWARGRRGDLGRLA